MTYSRGWRLRFVEQETLWPEAFDAVILTLPEPQLRPFAAHFPASWCTVLDAIRYDPCWAVMVSYRTPMPLPFDGRFMDGPVLGWVARNHSKPGRTGPETWTLHASAACPAEFSALGAPAPDWVQTHRWRYALPHISLALPDPGLWDTNTRLGLCGDGLTGGRVEGAWYSGKSCAEQLLAQAGPVVFAGP